MESEGKSVAGGDVLGGLEARGRAVMGSLAALGPLLERRLKDLAALSAEEGLGSELEKVIRETSRTLNLVIEYEGKIADARGVERGGDGLDLAEARREIRRRLDLRAGAR